MSLEAIALTVYVVGAVAGMVYCGVNDVRWGPNDWSGLSPFGPAWLSVAWPILIPATPYLFGKMLRRRLERRKLAVEERRKWLEAPLP